MTSHFSWMSAAIFEELCETAYKIAVKAQTWSDALDAIIAAGLAEDPAEADELIRAAVAHEGRRIEREIPEVIRWLDS
jgi:DNA-binding GntR family transcriptional regulator